MMYEDKSYIEQAEEFYQAALKGFQRGKRLKDDKAIRDAAEKAWNAIVQATNYLFTQAGYPVPKSHFERRKVLIELEDKDEIYKQKAFRDRHMAREQSLHEYCFYEGIYSLRQLKEELQKVKQYIEDTKDLGKCKGVKDGRED